MQAGGGMRTDPGRQRCGNDKAWCGAGHRPQRLLPEGGTDLRGVPQATNLPAVPHAADH